MFWPGLVWVRELLVVLSEVDFACVLTEVRLPVDDLFRSWTTTEPIETSLGVLTGVSSKNTKGELQSKARWQGLIASRLTTEYDRKPPPPALEARARGDQRKALPTSVFSGTGHSFSLGAGALRTLTHDNQCPSCSPAAWRAMAVFTALWVESAGNWALLKLAWWSLLIEVGDVLVNVAQPYNPRLVLHACRYGLLVWPMVA
jgi:hypothetical protein